MNVTVIVASLPYSDSPTDTKVPALTSALEDVLKPPDTHVGVNVIAVVGPAAVVSTGLVTGAAAVVAAGDVVGAAGDVAEALGSVVAAASVVPVTPPGLDDPQPAVANSPTMTTTPQVVRIDTS